MKVLLCILVVGMAMCDVNDTPDGSIFTKLAPGQITSTEFEAKLKGRRGFAGGRLSNETVRNGDIALTPRQYAYLFKRRGNWRKAEKDELRRWTNNVVPYVIDAKHFNPYQTRELHKAMDILMELTCLKFRPKVDSDENWIKYTDNNSGCNSMLGMMGWGRQSVNLGSGCKWQGLYLHEIGHALGLIHEHQRPDRDEQVKIIWRRVKSRYLDAFTTYKNDEVNNYGLDYDYSSVMHYEPEAFNDDQELTTIPRYEPWRLELMFRVYYKTLSFTDTKILNLMHKCGARCTNACSGKEYLDKHCRCVTPKFIHDALCKNERSDEYCYRKVKEGACLTPNGAAEMNIECRKACGSCPTYEMTDYVQPRLSRPFDYCQDRYHDSARCQEWAKDGACDKNRSKHWMRRYCKQSCNACNDPKTELTQATCRNYYRGAVDDIACDEQASKVGGCDDDLVKAGCQGSCKACGHQIPGDCENTKPDAECDARARRGDCDHNDGAVAARTQIECRKSCNSCSINKGECSNEDPDHECEIAAALGKCRIEPKKYQKRCRKSCNSCSFGIKDNSCEDIWPERTCSAYSEKGLCDERKGYAWRFCASSCNKCEWAKNQPCEDLNDDCATWEKTSECTSNHQFMSTHCAKSCGTCGRYDSGKCYNVDFDPRCEVQAKHGVCEDRKNAMARTCRRSCKLCDAPPIPKTWHCKDLSPHCDFWTEGGECESNPTFMEAFCHKSCGHCKSGGK